MNEAPRLPTPPFSYADAVQKVRMAEDAWNLQNPEKVSLAYTTDSKWRNRSEMFSGREEIVAFLTRKWSQESDYRLIKEIWAHSDDQIAVRFAYEWHDEQGQWYRSYGNENWRFDEQGRMAERHASINDVAITEPERKFLWPSKTTRPTDHPSLTELGL